MREKGEERTKRSLFSLLLAGTHYAEEYSLLTGSAPAAFRPPCERPILVGEPRRQRSLPSVQPWGVAPMHPLKVHGQVLLVEVSAQPLSERARPVADLQDATRHRPVRQGGRGSRCSGCGPHHSRRWPSSRGIQRAARYKEPGACPSSAETIEVLRHPATPTRGQRMARARVAAPAPPPPHCFEVYPVEKTTKPPLPAPLFNRPRSIVPPNCLAPTPSQSR